MDCKEATERLPWLLAGGLDAQEAEEVRRHLEGCAACAAEWRETRQAAGVFGAHLPAAAVLDLAWGQPVSVDPAVASAHLESCADCREDLELARESRRQAEAEPAALPAGPRELPMPAARPPRRPWAVAALPATLAAGLVAGVWWGGRVPLGERDSERRRAESLEAEVARLRAAFDARPPARSVGPRVNIPVFEVPPGSAVVRGSADGAHRVDLPAAANELALLLSADAPSDQPASVALRDANGREVWRADGLRYGPPGGYVIALPAAMLPDGAYALALTPGGGRPVAYRFEVRRTR